MNNKKIMNYILENGLPKEYLHSYKISGLSLEKFVELNSIQLVHFMIYKQYKEQKLDKQIQEQVDRQIKDTLKNLFD